MQLPLRPRAQAAGGQLQVTADAALCGELVAQRQRFGLRLLQQLVEAALFQVATALHETAQAAREVLQHIVHLAAAFQHGAGEATQEVAFVAVQAARKATRQHCFQRGIELGALFGVVEQAPEGLETAPGIALADHVHAFEQLRQDVTALAFIVDDAFAEITVELLEIVAHAAEVFARSRGQHRRGRSRHRCGHARRAAPTGARPDRIRSALPAARAVR
ncbi:hypothetical protein G6F32_013723 [Rhizopus arrhizus]|nr:hypothetical protein G6F32_013723 [Rhizopus arrhizus]